MHEALLARAVLPAPTVCLGLPLRPFSLGHMLWLGREQPQLLLIPSSGPIPGSAAMALPAAVLICCHTWRENARTRHDLLLPLKLWLWRRGVVHRQKKESSYRDQQLEIFRRYIIEGSLEFRPSDTPRPERVTARLPGAPLLLVLQQWLMTEFRLQEADAWDYPLGLAKMRWAAHWEQQGGIDIYNAHDASFDAFIAEQEAKGAIFDQSPSAQCRH